MPLLRLVLTGIIVAASLTMNGCSSLVSVKRPVEVPPLLTPLNQANTTQLIAEVNRLGAVRTIRGKVDIQFQDTSFAESGIADKYRTADGELILQRPGQIFLTIKAPFVGTDIAQMTSDGEHFRVAVLKGDEKYRRFVRGTNNASYEKLKMGEQKNEDGDGKKKKEAMNDQRAVSVLSNLRPQHLTDALLIPLIRSRNESGFIYAQSEFYQEEADTRPRAKKGARVVRGYYLLDELSPEGESGAHLVRRFWFDRVSGIRLARMQTFDNDGSLVTDVTYSEPKSFGESGSIQMPAHVELTRPQDHYKLSLSYQAPEAVVLDHEYKPDLFVLQNKWQLPEVDLDARRKAATN